MDFIAASDTRMHMALFGRIKPHSKFAVDERSISFVIHDTTGYLRIRSEVAIRQLSRIRVHLYASV